MMDFLRKHRRNIFIATVIVFVAGTFIGFGGYFFGDVGGGVVAEVNGKKISYQRYNFFYNRSLESLKQRNVELTPEVLKQVEVEVIQDLLQDEVFWQESQKFGITVSDKELSGNIRQFPAFQRDGQFDPRIYYEFLRRVLRTTPSEFEDFRRRQIAFLKLRHFISVAIYVPEQEAYKDFIEKFPQKTKEWEKEKQQYYQTYKQEVANSVFSEYIKHLNQTVKIKVFHKAT